MAEFKKAKECLDCAKHKKECKGLALIFKPISVYCPNKVTKEKKSSEKK